MKHKNLHKQRSLWSWKRKAFALLLWCFCLGGVTLMQIPSAKTKMLLLSSSGSGRISKIAFLFIARNRLPLDDLWDAFFRGNELKFSIYVHSRPGFVLNNATTRSVYFYGRQVNDSIQVAWGESSMIQAERILLKHALGDPSNDRFILVSDSCIPLYNFTYTYEYIILASSSFIDSFADTSDSRYNPKMHPMLPIWNWRKGSQWVVLIRKHAVVVAEDESVYPIFQQHCRRKTLPEFWRNHPLVIPVLGCCSPWIHQWSITAYRMSIIFPPYLLKRDWKKKSHGEQ